MKLHVFNPEHDIALAANLSQFTAPHAGRELRADLGHIPALWAEKGDMVLVDDVPAALSSIRHLHTFAADVCFISPDDLRHMLNQLGKSPFDEISVWGWDKAIVRQLERCGIKDMLPSKSQLELIREMSSRQWASAHLLNKLVELNPQFVGNAHYVTSMDELHTSDFSFERVLKAPWSSSGRGVRYDLSEEHRKRNDSWARNIISRQGGIMVEPYYNKVIDFGMEFEANENGQVVYRGLSVFKTTNGAYIGSVIASENAKRKILGRYLAESIIDEVKDAICRLTSELFKNAYQGPFGVDMMIVAEDGILKLHPCVELNLRRTMGHVALAILSDDLQPQRLMRVSYTDKYRLQIINTNENVINNSLI
ncbi:MAG: hypothetical protein K6C10_06365 [Prevotella sp.]|nr:hypothetical protein [Prevotella sp.]